MEELRVVDFQQHTSDLASQAGMHILDKWEETLTWEKKRGKISINLIL